MADVKISDLLAGTPADTDQLEVETAGGASRRLTRAQITQDSAPANHTHPFTQIVSVPTQRLLGRDDAGTGDAEALTDAEARTLLNVADGATDDTAVNAHIADATAAHAASAISFAPTANIASIDVQGAIDEVEKEAPRISSENTLLGQMQLAVVATLPGTPDDNTIYFITT